jgi:hypothetical protein
MARGRNKVYQSIWDKLCDEEADRRDRQTVKVLASIPELDDAFEQIHDAREAAEQRITVRESRRMHAAR